VSVKSYVVWFLFLNDLKWVSFYEFNIILQNAGALPGAGLYLLGYRVMLCLLGVPSNPKLSMILLPFDIESLLFLSAQQLQDSRKSAVAQIHRFSIDKHNPLQNSRKRFVCPWLRKYRQKI